jgi:hypothetical protein
MEEERSSSRITHSGILLICCLLLGFFGDLLFYGKPLGISYPLFTATFLIIFYFHLKNMNIVLQKPGVLLLVPLMALAATFALHNNIPLLVLNFLVIPFLLVTKTILTAGANRYNWFDFRFLLDILEGVFGRTLINIGLPFRMVKDLLKGASERQRFEVLKRIMTGLLVALPLLLVIILLLSSADLVFSHYLGRLPEFLGIVKLGEFVAHTLLITVIAVFSFTYINSFRKSEENKTAPEEISAKPLELKTRWDPITVSTFLAALNLVYIIFVAIQFSYLFGGGRFALPEGYTFAEYARQGFFELLVVTLINFIIFIFVINFVHDERRVLFNLFRILLSLLSASTLVMLISSFFRLALYEEAYGYTYARVAAHALIIYLFILFLAAIYRIWQDRYSLLKTFIMVSIVVYLSINFFGIDRFIATANIDRYFRTGQIDVTYLANLSDDAVPQLVNLLSAADEEVALYIENDLYFRKERLSDQNWQSFNWSRFRAASILKEYQLTWHTLDYPSSYMD